MSDFWQKQEVLGLKFCINLGMKSALGTLYKAILQCSSPKGINQGGKTNRKHLFKKQGIRSIFFPKQIFCEIDPTYQ